MDEPVFIFASGWSCLSFNLAILTFVGLFIWIVAVTRKYTRIGKCIFFLSLATFCWSVKQDNDIWMKKHPEEVALQREYEQKMKEINEHAPCVRDSLRKELRHSYKDHDDLTDFAATINLGTTMSITHF